MEPSQYELLPSHLTLLYFHKDGFGIKWPMNTDISLNKETKPNQTKKKST